MAAYEVLNSFVTNAANDSLHIVAKLSDIILHRLENTIPMQRQIVSVEDRITLEEIQTSLTSVLLVSHVSHMSLGHHLFTNSLKSIIQRLEGEIKPQADRIMHVVLQILNTVGPKSSVPDTVFAAVGALSNALEVDFAKYMDSFAPFLYNALGNQDELGLCAMAIGLVSDITRSLGESSQPYCDTFMNYLLSNLRVGAVSQCGVEKANIPQSTSVSNQFKPAILQCFGDIAQAIGPHFEAYLNVVALVLQQAATVTMSDNGAYEMLDYIISLREGIMDAWSGIILALKQGKGLWALFYHRKLLTDSSPPIDTIC